MSLKNPPYLRQKKVRKSTSRLSNTADTLREQAFENSAQANIIFEVKTGKLIMANLAACQLLGYSQKEILRTDRSGIFAVTESNFKKMLVKRKTTGQAVASVNAILKNGELLPCEISSAIFKDEHGVETSITAITDMRANIATQKKIDDKNEKIVDNNILIAQKKASLALEESSQWLKYFAETSYDVMWDWDIASGKIYIGKSIEDIFGYKIQNDIIDYQTIHNYILPAEIDSFKSKIKKHLSSRKRSWEDSFSIRRKDGVMASTTSRACIIRDENGMATRLVGATQDVSKVTDLEKNLHDLAILHKEGQEKFALATKLSFDVIWDWNLENNDLFIGEGFKKLFGYPIKKNKGDMTKDWVNYIHPDDKDSITLKLANTIKSKATQWNQAYRIIRSDKSIAKVYVRASILRTTDGRAYRMIGAVQDLSRQKDLEEQLDIQVKNNLSHLDPYAANFNLIFNSASDIFYDLDLLSNVVVVSDAFEKSLGYKVFNNTVSGKEWLNHIHPDDLEPLMAEYKKLLRSKECEWKYDFRYLKSDNSAMSIQGSSILLRHPDGKAYRIIGSMQDAGRNTNSKNKLSLEIASRENAMLSALEEARIAERSEIGKELHDNVNQLLGASKLYLEMAKKGGKNSKLYLSRSTEYTLTAIEEIRNLTKGLTTDVVNILGLLGSIKNLASDLMEVQPLKITLQLDPSIEELISSNIKLHIFRIVQEQLNNIIKHADASTVIISFARNKNLLLMIITDNGKGFDVSQTSRGIGLNNIAERAKLIKATSELISKIGKGTTFILKLELETSPV
jgi:PAS domain S-box-containing protein